MNLDINDERFQRTVDFHGHLCPGVLIGYRASLIGLVHLGAQRSEDEELIAIIENNSCSADAVQYLTGCTFGKGNLIFRDWGKQVFTFAYRPDGRGVRVLFTGDRLKPVLTDGSTDREAFTRLLMEAPDEDLFQATDVTINLPRMARIFPTIPCDICGEGTMQPRLVQIDGKQVCPACFLAGDPDVVMDQVANFLFEVGMLKKTPRTGYQFLGNGKENVAEHSFRTTVIGFLLGRWIPEADSRKVAEMCLFHDLPEARTGDHNYVNKQYVTDDEERAAHDAAANVPWGKEIEALLAEFREGKTLEAQLAHDADQLDLVFELKEKSDLGNKYAEAWLYYAEKRLRTDVGRAMYQAVIRTDWTNWWFDRKEHLWVRND